MLRLNAHFHVDFYGFSTESIIDYMNKNRFEQCWLLTWEEKNPPIPSIYEHLPVEKLMEAYSKYPDRIVPFYAPDPGTPGIKNKMEQLISLGLKGCGELKVTYMWEDTEIEQYLKTVTELNIPLLFHMEDSREHYIKKNESLPEKLLDNLMNGALNGLPGYYLKKATRHFPSSTRIISKNLQHFPGYLYDFAYLEKRIKQFPSLNFIGHGPHFWNNISKSMSDKYIHQRGKIKDFGIIDRLLEENENFYCDISGKSGYNALTRDRLMARIFLEKHSDKILFGTDNTGYDFDALLDSFKLTAEKLEKIYYLNAKRIIP